MELRTKALQAGDAGDDAHKFLLSVPPLPPRFHSVVCFIVSNLSFQQFSHIMDACHTVTTHMFMFTGHKNINLLKCLSQGTWLAQWKECATLNLGS